MAPTKIQPRAALALHPRFQINCLVLQNQGYQFEEYLRNLTYVTSTPHIPENATSRYEYF